MSPNPRALIIVAFFALIRLEEDRRRDLHTESLGGREIDRKPYFHWLFDGQVGWFGTSQYFVDIIRAASKRIRELWPIGHEAPIQRKQTEFVHRGYPILVREVQYSASVSDC